MPAKVIQVIEVQITRGNGVDTVMRGVTQYFSFDGQLLAENDPCEGNDIVATRQRDSD